MENVMSFTAEDVKAVRKRHGISMMDAKRACEIGDQRFGGDFELGAYWIHANGFAVTVKGGPDARAKWNDQWAMSKRTPQ